MFNNTKMQRKRHSSQGTNQILCPMFNEGVVALSINSSSVGSLCVVCMVYVCVCIV